MFLAIDEVTASGGHAGFELHGESTPVRQLVAEVWANRELLRILARKEFFVRYRRAVLGLFWAAALPLVQASVLAVLLEVLDLDERFGVEVNTLLFVFAGMLVWGYFSTSVAAGSTAVVDSTELTTKIYFPRAILPLVRVASNLYGLALTVAIVLVMAVVTGSSLDARLLLIVPAVALLFTLSAGFSLALSALHVYFRDVRYVVQAALLAWFYVTPVFYPLEKMRGFRPVIEANPVTAPLQLLRVAVGADGAIAVPLAWSLGWAVVLVAVGIAAHARYNRVFVDLL